MLIAVKVPSTVGGARVTSRDELAHSDASSPTSARPLIEELLHGLVRPNGGAMWTATLLHVADLMGIQEKTARQALFRLAAGEMIVATRCGRATRWTVTGPELHPPPAPWAHEWDEHWVTLSIMVPESERRVRHHLRERLSRLRFGSPRPGVWVAAGAAAEQAANRVIADLGLASHTLCCVGRLGALHDARDLVRRSWDLDTQRQRLAEFIAAVRTMDATGPMGHVRAFAMVRQAWAGVVETDPCLPAVLLPDGWPGVEAHDLFRERERAWLPTALRQWAELDRRLSPVRHPGALPDDTRPKGGRVVRAGPGATHRGEAFALPAQHDVPGRHPASPRRSGACG